MKLADSFIEFMDQSADNQRIFNALGSHEREFYLFNRLVRIMEQRGFVARSVFHQYKIGVTKTPKYYSGYGGSNTVASVLDALPNTPTMDAGDKSAASIQKTPWRVSLESMKKNVDSVEYIHPESIPHMTIAVVLLKNGYALQGVSVPADPANFNEEKGREFAFEDALKKMWALEAYVMREYITGNITGFNPAERW